MAEETSFRPAVRLFKSQLWQIRDERGITFEELAESMGVSAPYISVMLRRGPTLKQVETIAKALDLPPQYFDVYHILSFERNVREGDPEALRFAQLMRRVSQMPEKRRTKVMADLLARVDEAR